MQFLKVRSDNLNEFLSSDLYKNSENLIIPEMRAQSMANNPLVAKQDVLFIVAQKQSNIVGIIGLLLDLLQDGRQICWNSGWWIDKNEGFRTSMALFKMFMEEAGQRVLITDTTLKTTQILRHMPGFEELPGRMAFRFFLHVPDKLTSNFLMRILGNTYRILLKLMVRIGGPKNITLVQTTAQDLEEAQIEAFNASNSVQISRNKLKWIQENPWITTGNKVDKRPYPFSYQVNQSFAGLYLIKEENQTVGWVMMTIVNGIMKIPYAHFNHLNTKIIARIILSEGIKRKCSSIYLMNREIVANMRRNLPFFAFKKKYEVPLFASESLEISKPVVLQDGDGDAVFT